MRYIFIPLFVVLLCFSYTNLSKAIECLPSCSPVDGRFLTVSGPDLSTIVEAQIVVNLVSKGDNLEFGIFDGDAGDNWDSLLAARLELHYELYADPAGNSSGLAGPLIALWTSDGTLGQNIGMPMSNNDWSDFTFPNVSQAQAPNGDYIYTLRIVPANPMIMGATANVFKVRTADMMYVPAMFPVAFIATVGQETLDATLEDIFTIFPNAFTTDGGVTFCGLPAPCDQTDPNCCFFETTYDGMWSFFMDVPPGETALDVWDGDLDYGDFLGTVFDSDDPNTPGNPFLPTWSIGTDVVFETARGANPHDDNMGLEPTPFNRSPSVQYLVIDPLGNSYQNFNPSGDREWELFRLDTLTGDPSIAEYMVDSIPPGQWEVKLIGVDMLNLNSLLLPFDLRGVEGEDPDEDPTTVVPTLNEWGLITLAFMGLIISVLYLKRKKKTALNN